MINNEKRLRVLVKEDKIIQLTYLKIASVEKIEAEFQGLIFIKKIGFNAPAIIKRTKDSLSTEYIRGISAFTALEILSRKKKVDLVYNILDELCRGVKIFHSKCKFLKVNKYIPYQVDVKVPHITTMLKESNIRLAKQLENITPQIVEYYKKANIPFRDATPKNYIMSDVSKDSVDVLNDSNYRNKLTYIDASSMNELTFLPDDFISILFHYMIEDDIRLELLKKYEIDMNSKEFIISAFVRFGRFWVRRQYYKKYLPEIFRKRYTYEKIGHYNKIMMEYTKKVIELLN